jgi:GNAT superfamily N-acetyltransferase
VYVCEKYRKLGLAKKMLNEIERYFGELKVEVLMLTADDAIDFWNHNGYSNTLIKAVNDLSILIKRI